jgi:hypothetical protein
VLFYPVYALLFADAGLSTARISTLFVIWSVVSFVFEVPSGAWADAWSRRRLYAIGAFLTAAGFASWTFWPTYAGFALGFVLWGLGGALCSGTLEALLYEELGDGGAYARVAGRGGTVAILAMLAATVLAAPSFAFGGYLLVGVLSVAVRAAGGCLALGFHETGPEGTGSHATGLEETGSHATGLEGTGSHATGLEETGLEGRARAEAARETEPEGTVREETTRSETARQGASRAETPAETAREEAAGRGYLRTLRAGLGEVRGSRRVAWAVAIAALVPGFTALDEYLPLLSRAAGAPTVAVPLLFALPALAMAIGSTLAGRWAQIAASRLAAGLATAAVLLAGGALSGRLVGMLPVALAFGILQFAIIVTETRLQESITGAARATVLSVAGFASEVFAVLLYAVFGAGAAFASVPALFALCALPLLATAFAVRRCLPGS